MTQEQYELLRAVIGIGVTLWLVGWLVVAFLAAQLPEIDEGE